jgi:hypothetical protein
MKCSGLAIVAVFVSACSAPPPPSPVARKADSIAAPRPPPLALALGPELLSVENRTDGPLEQCLVQIFGGWVGLVPAIHAHSTESSFFTALFDSEDHEYQAHVAGQTFQEYVFANATTKTTVTCRDLDGQRVAMVFRP